MHKKVPNKSASSEFTSRICKNCKFYSEQYSLCNVIPENDNWILDSMDRITPNAQFCPDENFGCNRFEGGEK